MALTRRRFLVTLLCLLCAPAFAIATEHYVSPSGADSNPGTSGLPFRTVQRGVNAAQAGDIVTIAEGTYRETVTPPNSGASGQPIVIRAATGARVVISGADVVTGWSVHAGPIYKAPFAGALGDKDQIFVDGQMMNLARWPNTSLDVSRPVKATATTGTYDPVPHPNPVYTGTYTDPALTQPAGFFNGARIHTVIGPGWVAQTGTVINYSPGSVSFDWRKVNAYSPAAGNQYFLFDLLTLLDTGGEWFIDRTANILYLWLPQNDAPAGHLIEAKKRDFGFDLTNRSYITIEGLSFFACSINSSNTSQQLILDGLNCRYLSHYARNDTVNGFGSHMEDSGIILKGSRHILRNSELAFSAGNAVTLLGDHHLVQNCLIHDVDYLAVDCGAINTGNSSSTSTDHEISYNTCYNSARGLLLIRSLVRGSVHHNDLYRSMLTTTDGGPIYSFGHDGQNTVIAYNRIHDNMCGGNGSAGIYLDNNSTNFVVHHNLIYNTVYAMGYNLPSTNILWYNNTCVPAYRGLSGVFSGSQAGTEVRNNIFTKPIVTYAEAGSSNNVLEGVDPQFVSAAALDFRIQSASPAHNTGMELPPYTNGYEGAAPDIGALEAGQTPWTAGASLATGIAAGPTHLAAMVSGLAIGLTWQDNSSGETAFIVERTTGSVDKWPFIELARLPANATSYLDSTVKRGYLYTYRVRADESANSNHSAAIVPGRDPFTRIDAESLDAQSGLTVASTFIGSCDNNDWARFGMMDFGAGSGEITLRASSGSSSTTNFIEVRLGSVTGTRIGNINILGTGSYSTYTLVTSAITAVSGLQDVFFVFKGGSGVCNLDYFTFTPQTSLSQPPAPADLAATALSQDEIRLTWTPPGASQLGFKLERANDNQNFIEIASVSAATGAFTDGGLVAGVNYFYRVRAYNNQGFSGYTATESAVIPDITPPVLTLPANITTVATSTSGAVVNYTASASDDGSGVATASFLPASGSTFPIGTTTVNASATDRSGNTATGSFTVTVWTPAEAWRQTMFGTTANTGNAADNADPNFNGIKNLLEYALGGDPVGNTTGTGILPQLGFSPASRLQIAFTRYVDRGDLALTVFAADSVAGPWTALARSTAGGAFVILEPGATAPESGSGNTRTVTATDLYPVTDPAHPRRFMKLEVSR